MEQKRIALVLEWLTAFAALVLALIFFWYLPLLGWELATVEVPCAAFLFWPCLIFVWVIAVLCYAALFRFWTVCREIGRGNSFSHKNARAFRWIGRYAASAGVLFLSLMAVLMCIGYFAPPWFLLFNFLIFVCLGIAVLCFCLARLISRAADLKEQNDLTI